MFCSITLGVGVDYAIHFLESFRRARRRQQPLPVRHALAESGPTIGRRNEHHGSDRGDQACQIPAVLAADGLLDEVSAISA
jgi:hypothetical protein